MIVHTDASKVGLGGVLSQIRAGEEHPVTYISRKLLNCGEGGPSHQVGTRQVKILPPGQGVHACHRPCSPQVEGQRKGYKRTSPPGLQVPGGPQAGQGTQQRSNTLSRREP